MTIETKNKDGIPISLIDQSFYEFTHYTIIYKNDKFRQTSNFKYDFVNDPLEIDRIIQVGDPWIKMIPDDGGLVDCYSFNKSISNYPEPLIYWVILKRLLRSVKGYIHRKIANKFNNSIKYPLKNKINHYLRKLR